MAKRQMFQPKLDEKQKRGLRAVCMAYRVWPNEFTTQAVLYYGEILRNKLIQEQEADRKRIEDAAKDETDTTVEGSTLEDSPADTEAQGVDTEGDSAGS